MNQVLATVEWLPPEMARSPLVLKKQLPPVIPGEFLQILAMKTSISASSGMRSSKHQVCQVLNAQAALPPSCGSLMPNQLTKLVKSSSSSVKSGIPQALLLRLASSLTVENKESLPLFHWQMQIPATMEQSTQQMESRSMLLFQKMLDQQVSSGY